MERLVLVTQVCIFWIWGRVQMAFPTKKAGNFYFAQKTLMCHQNFLEYRLEEVKDDLNP